MLKSTLLVSALSLAAGFRAAPLRVPTKPMAAAQVRPSAREITPFAPLSFLVPPS